MLPSHCCRKSCDDGSPGCGQTTRNKLWNWKSRMSKKQFDTNSLETKWNAAKLKILLCLRSDEGYIIMENGPRVRQKQSASVVSSIITWFISYFFFAIGHSSWSLIVWCGFTIFWFGRYNFFWFWLGSVQKKKSQLIGILKFRNPL